MDVLELLAHTQVCSHKSELRTIIVRSLVFLDVKVEVFRQIPRLQPCFFCPFNELNVFSFAIFISNGNEIVLRKIH